MANTFPEEVKFPELPEGYRWKIVHPFWDTFKKTDRLRRVKIQRKDGPFWFTVNWTVWRVHRGLGDFSRANPHDWFMTNGLASAMGYLMSKEHERLNAGPASKIHGTSA